MFEIFDILLPQTFVLLHVGLSEALIWPFWKFSFVRGCRKILCVKEKKKIFEFSNSNKIQAKSVIFLGFSLVRTKFNIKSIITYKHKKCLKCSGKSSKFLIDSNQISKLDFSRMNVLKLRKLGNFSLWFCCESNLCESNELGKSLEGDERLIEIEWTLKLKLAWKVFMFIDLIPSSLLLMAEWWGEKSLKVQWGMKKLRVRILFYFHHSNISTLCLALSHRFSLVDIDINIVTRTKQNENSKMREMRNIMNI